MTSTIFRRFFGSCGLAAVLGLIPLLSGCADSPPWGAWSKSPTPEQIQAVMGRPLETFIYFTRYEVYQNESTREYIYQENEEWVHRAEPPAAIAEAKLQASPFVVLSLREGPAESYAKVRKQHPSDLGKNQTLVAAVP